MSKKTKTEEAALPVDMESQLAAAHEQGYARARADCLRLLLQGNDNLGIAFSDALYWAGKDDSGVFYLSAAATAHNQPTHITGRVRDTVKSNRRLNISQLSPYRVTRN